MARPGVMFYFDFLPGLECLNDSLRCRVYDAVMAYGRYGVVPEFEDPVANAVWQMIRPKLDVDQKAYEEKVEKRRSAAHARWEAEKAAMQMHTEYSQENFAQERKREDTIRNETKGEETIPKEKREDGLGSSSSSMAPPSIEEVTDYCRSKGLLVDPEEFMDYYTANGWMLGDNPMRSWQATLGSWNKMRKEKMNKHGYANTDQTAGIPVGTFGHRL